MSVVNQANEISWDETVDFLSVGSGAGGMTGALTAKLQGLVCAVIEKSDKYGGTTALSGGVIWVPNHHLMSTTAISDSEEEGIAYLEQVVSQDACKEKMVNYVKYAPEMLSFLEQKSLVQFEPATEYPDYYSELSGGKPGARSLDPKPYSIRKLGMEYMRQLRRAEWFTHESFSMTAAEAHIVCSFDYRSPLIILKRLLHYYLDIVSRWRGLPDNRLTLGRALVSRLRKSLHNVGVPVHLNTSIKALIVDQGRVIGVHCVKADQPYYIKVNRAVLMATGGFAHNKALRQSYHPHPDVNRWTASSPTDTGDGLWVGKNAGAKWSMMDYAWWSPTMMDKNGNTEAFIIGKSLPNGMIVNKAGRRFLNEAEPYEDFVKDMFASHQHTPCIPAYFIFDHRYRKEYPLGMMLPPGKYKPDVTCKELLTSGWLKKAETLEELAEICGIDAEGLVDEAKKLRQFAKTGIDTDFGKGQTANDRYYSDHRVSPNPCLAFEEQGPFYAVNIYPGDLGTKGGLATDQYARVIDGAEQVIEGLYATGNVSASVMGNSYPGAGSTIGPAMAFGYIAAMHAADQLED